MKAQRTGNHILTLLLIFLAATTAAGRTVTIPTETLKDKIRGAWAGQTIGCTYGGPTEFRYRDRIIPDSIPIEWPEHFVKWYFDHAPGLYDDIYMDLTFVDVFERQGLDAPVSAFAEAFAHAPYPLWHANQSARYNILTAHLTPPASGFWKNNPHSDDIDFQIEADFSGIMSPGMPQTAARIGDPIGHIMNYGDGWYGGVFVGTMYALSFISSDIPYIVREALKAIPKKSDFYRCLTDVIEGYRLYPDDWKKTWQRVQAHWSKEKGCPEGVMAPLNIDAKINSAYIAIGLLYGRGDFARTLEIATRCGQDSDCNPSSAGGILGCIMGYRNIPEKWLTPLREVEDVPFKYTDISLHKVYDMSTRQALKVVEREGGRVDGSEVVIRTQKPKTVRLEQAFEGMEPAQKTSLSNKNLSQETTIEFEGCGIVVRGEVKAQETSYAAMLEVQVDGRTAGTMHLPAAHHDRSNDLYWNYDLPQGRHTLTLKLLNPQPGATVTAWDYLVYRKTQK